MSDKRERDSHVPEIPKKTQDTPQVWIDPAAPKGPRWWLIFLVAFLGFGLVISRLDLGGQNTVTNRAPIPVTPQATRVPRPTFVGIGEEGVLLAWPSPGVDKMPIFWFKRALDDFVRAVTVKDSYGYREALRTAYAVPTGTRLLVIESAGLGRRRVRILEGAYIGRAGFILSEWVGKP